MRLSSLTPICVNIENTNACVKHSSKTQILAPASFHCIGITTHSLVIHHKGTRSYIVRHAVFDRHGILFVSFIRQEYIEMCAYRIVFVLEDSIVYNAVKYWLLWPAIFAMGLWDRDWDCDSACRRVTQKSPFINGLLTRVDWLNTMSIYWLCTNHPD